MSVELLTFPSLYKSRQVCKEWHEELSFPRTPDRVRSPNQLLDAEPKDSVRSSPDGEL